VRILGAAAAVLIGAIVVAVLLWQRAASAPPPRELLAGGNEPPAPRVAPELESLDRGALQAAADYAGEHGSRALIVSRHDHIVFERYWQGSGFDTLADAQSFTPLLAALATGVAISHRQIGWPDEPIGALISEWRQDPRGATSVRNLLQSPADAQLLALVLERATHQRYALYLSQVLWRRIGAADAWLRLEHPGGAARADCCLLARQGDWIRIGQLLLRDGNYRGDEVIRPGWVTYLRLGSPAAHGREPYAARDLFAVQGEQGNRLWLVPSLQIAILRTAPAERDAAWDDSRIPNLIIRAARDYLPPAEGGANVSALVPAHKP
jgi:CubicO group peptidase (beta-lactamase class C family)